MRPKGNPDPLQERPGCSKGGKMSAVFMNKALMIGFGHVKRCEPFVASMAVEDVLNLGDRLTIGNGLAVEWPVVDAEAKCPVLLSYAHHWTTEV